MQLEKDESLVKLLIVLWRIWDKETPSDSKDMGPMLYIAFETLERDEIRRKGAIAALENALKDVKIKAIADLNINRAFTNPESYRDEEIDSALKKRDGARATHIKDILEAVADESASFQFNPQGDL